MIGVGGVSKGSAPSFHGDAFNCPRCGAFAHQTWWSALMKPRGSPFGLTTALEDTEFSKCYGCGGLALWVGGKLSLPTASVAPVPAERMPPKVSSIYDEAAQVFGSSPRAAAALLRLALQTLVIELGEQGRDLDTDIGVLVKKGLPAMVQQSLDSLRVIGNNAVHPGEIDVNENPEMALQLFNLLNLIVEYMIRFPEDVAKVYGQLPDGARKAIEKRDGKPPTDLSGSQPGPSQS